MQGNMEDFSKAVHARAQARDVAPLAPRNHENTDLLTRMSALAQDLLSNVSATKSKDTILTSDKLVWFFQVPANPTSVPHPYVHECQRHFLQKRANHRPFPLLLFIQR